MLFPNHPNEHERHDAFIRHLHNVCIAMRAAYDLAFILTYNDLRAAGYFPMNVIEVEDAPPRIPTLLFCSSDGGLASAWPQPSRVYRHIAKG